MKKFLIVALFAFYAVAALADAGEMASDDFLKQVLALVAQFGGLSWLAKVSAICMLLVSSMKVSFLRPLWDKLGSLKVFAAPVFALAGGVLSLGELNLQAALAYLGAGAGAIILHELLDAVKAIPGLNSWVAVGIDILQKILRRPEPSALEQK